MQSVTQYGRIVARAIVAQFHNEFQVKSPVDKKEPLHFVTGSSGFSKSVTQSSQLSKWTFGDDAYFISRNKVADVIGKESSESLRSLSFLKLKRCPWP